MRKIRVEIEVPDKCGIVYPGITWYCRSYMKCEHDGECRHFDEKIVDFEPCQACKDAEVRDEN